MVIGMLEKNYVKVEVRPKINGKRVVNTFVTNLMAGEGEVKKNISGAQETVNIMVHGKDSILLDIQVIVKAITILV